MNQNTAQNNILILLENSSENNFREITFENFLSEKERKENKKYYNGWCKLGILGNIIYIIILCIFCLGLSISLKITTFKNNKIYSDLRELFLTEMELKTTKNDFLLYFPFNYYKFWCNIVYWEDPIILSQIIIFLIYILFLIILIYTYISYIKKQNNDGIIYKLFIFLNYLFHYVIKLSYLSGTIILLWEFIILFEPICFDDSKEIVSEKCNIWMKKRFSSFSNHVGRGFFLLLFTSFLRSPSKKIVILLLGMKYDKETSDNRFKKASIAMGGQIKEIEIKMNGNIYLENQNYRLIFKQILIKEITNSYVYIKTNNISIEDQLSITNWDYPKIDNIIKNYDLIETYLYNIIYNSFFCAYIFFVKDDNKYDFIKDSIKKNKINIKFENIYILYGDLDNIIKSIFWIIVIYYIYILYSMGKRILFGGDKNSFCIIISFSLSFIFMLIIIIYIVLTCILATFSILCSYSLSEIIKKINYQNDIKIFLAIHSLLSTFIFNILFYLFIFSSLIYILIISIRVFRKIKEIKRNYYIINKNKFENENEMNSEIRYLGLDLNQHILNEYIIKGYPRNLFFTFKENAYNDNITDKIKNSIDN